MTSFPLVGYLRLNINRTNDIRIYSHLHCTRCAQVTEVLKAMVRL